MWSDLNFDESMILVYQSSTLTFKHLKKKIYHLKMSATKNIKPKAAAAFNWLYF